MLRQLKAAAKRHEALVRAVRSAYPVLSWVSNQRGVYERVAPYLAEMEFDEVRLSGRGNEPEQHLRRTTTMLQLANADVLVLGVGSGDELTLWEEQRPRTLTATDFFSHPGVWAAHPAARFTQADVRRLPFADASFDLVASTALLEHVAGVDQLADEMLRVLRPGGVAFANFGPLYYTHGGAHYAGAYEHLWMSDAQFEQYLVARGIASELDDGLVWLRNGMFSRLHYDDYLDIFKPRFDLDHVVLAVSPAALRYQRAHPDEWRALTARYAERDLLTFSMTVWMRKPLAASVPMPATTASAVAA